MSKFPEPVNPPEAIPEARNKRLKDLIKASTIGISIRVFIATIELIIALAFGSAAIFMDALAASVDIVASIVLLISIKLASKPPDHNHPFGHGRYEPLAGLQLGLFLIFLGGAMFFYNTVGITHDEHYSTLNPHLWLVPLGALLLLEFSYQMLKRAAKRQDSPALEAEAFHYRVDSLTSLFALIALLAASFSPRFGQLFDHSGAAFISLFMIILGFNASKNNLNQIMDHVPSKDYFVRIKNAALRATGVRDTEKIRMQQFGPDAHIDIDIEVDPQLSVKEAHQISQQVRLEIQKEIPQTRDVIVHVEPYYPNDH